MKSPLYSKTCQILDRLSLDKKSTFKTTVFNIISPDDEYFKRVYCLAAEITKNAQILDLIISSEFSNTDINQMKISSSMLKVLLYEIFLSEHKFKQGGRLIRFIKSKSTGIRSIINNSNFQSVSSKSATNVMTCRILSHPIDKEEYKSIKDKLLDIADKDEDIKDLFILKNIDYDKEKKILFEMRDSNKIKIQSKSSSLPAFLLYKIIKKGYVNNLYLDKSIEKEGLDIIDSCAAPGNKTLQLADYFFEFNFKVLAFDSDKTRFSRLANNIKFNNYSDAITAYNADFLLIDPLDEKYKNVNIILCDPSCSGSGTFNNALENSELSKNCSLEIKSKQEESERLKNLSSFQLKVIQHSMKFPNVKIISYSTCSVYKEENEDVVDKVLACKEGNLFELGDIGSIIDKTRYHFSKDDKCLRTCKKCFGMDGFFVALFIRKGNN